VKHKNIFATILLGIGGLLMISRLFRQTTVTRPHDLPEPDDDDEIEIWKLRGIEDVSFQREAQVTWWSILSGLAVAILLDVLIVIVNDVRGPNWHYALYFAASTLLSINLWMQYAWASLILRWPLNIFHSVLTFMMGITAAAACLQVRNPRNWYITIAVFLVFAIAVLVNNFRAGAWDALSEEDKKLPRMVIGIYALALIVTILGAVTLSVFTSRFVEVFWGIVAFGAVISSLVMHYFQMNFEKSRLHVSY